MTLEDLKILVTVAETPSMGAAARLLGRTQPAVAQHIRRLEAEFGTELMIRGPRGSTLTEAGKLLYRRASMALRALETASREIKEQQTGSPTIGIAASTTTAEHFLKQPILALRKRYAQLRLRMEMGTTVAERLEAVRQRRVDLAFITIAEPARHIETRIVFEMPLRLLVHRDHPLARRKQLPLRALREIRYVALRNSTAVAYLRARVADASVMLEVAESVDTAATAILHVELGLGETFVPEHQVPSVLASGHVRAIRVTGLPATPLGWASLDFDLVPPIGNALMEEVAMFAKEWRPKSPRKR